MGFTVVKARLPGGPVSVTDGEYQVQFDVPADMVDYLDLHPEVAARIAEFTWTTVLVASGN
jgi:hypothetical protein